MAPLSGDPAGMPGKPRPAEPKDFPTLELRDIPGNAGGAWAAAAVAAPTGTISCAAGWGFGCG